MTYFSYFHSIMTYGIIFWGNSTDSNEIFKLQKKLLELLPTQTTELHVINDLRNQVT